MAAKQGLIPGGDTKIVISNLSKQNERLKNELKMLNEKLEQQSKQKKQTLGPLEKDEQMLEKEAELKTSQNNILKYKKEIESLRKSNEGPYNIQKIVALEDEHKNKMRILK